MHDDSVTKATCTEKTRKSESPQIISSMAADLPILTLPVSLSWLRYLNSVSHYAYDQYSGTSKCDTQACINTQMNTARTLLQLELGGDRGLLQRNKAVF